MDSFSNQEQIKVNFRDDKAEYLSGTKCTNEPRSGVTLQDTQSSAGQPSRP